MLNIRAESVYDLGAISEVNNLAFKGESESRLIETIRASDFFIPNLSLVAEISSRVVGHILFSQVSIETAHGGIPTLALAPLAVRPEYQNQGIGSALVREGLQTCWELGFHHVVVLGHSNYYPRFGFVPAVTKGISAPFPVSDEHFMVCEIKNGSLSGVNGTVKYPPSFDV